MKTDNPTVLFLDEKKFERPFIVRTCFPVCDLELSWEKVVREVPFAIAWSGASEDNIKRDLEYCRKIGLSEHERIVKRGKELYAMIATNKLFTDWFGESDA